jgi:hypothetical protein
VLSVIGQLCSGILHIVPGTGAVSKLNSSAVEFFIALCGASSLAGSEEDDTAKCSLRSKGWTFLNFSHFQFLKSVKNDLYETSVCEVFSSKNLITCYHDNIIA